MGQTPGGKAWQPLSQRQSAGPPVSPGRKLARAGRGEGAGGVCGWGAEQEVGVARWHDQSEETGWGRGRSSALVAPPPRTLP